MRRSHLANALRLLVSALSLHAVPSLLSAQAVTTTISIALSGTLAGAEFRERTCVAESKRGSRGGESTPTDTLRLRVQDDRQQPVHPHGALIVRAEGAPEPLLTVPTDSAQYTKLAAKPGEFLSTLVTIIRESDNLPICTVLLREPVAPTSEDTSRRAFRVGIGASFDFLSGLSGTDLYYDVTAFLPRIWSTATGAYGLDMGLYNGRTVARRDTLPGSARMLFFEHAQPDSLLRIRQQGTLRREIVEDRLGVYAAPTVQLASSLHFVVHAELVKSSLLLTNTITVDTTDTTVVARAAGPPQGVAPAGTLLPDSVSTRRVTELGSYFATGFLVQYQHPATDIELRLKPLVGLAVVNGHAVGRFVVQGRVTDFDNGLKIGAEVRADLRTAANPLLLVYLAKDFGLKRLANFVVGGDKDE